MKHDNRWVGPLFIRNDSLLMTWSSGIAEMWKVESGELVNLFPNQGQLRGIVLNTDSSRMLTWSSEPPVAWLWDLKTLRSPVKLEHRGKVNGGLFSRDGDIATSFSDSLMRQWDSRTGASLGEQELPRAIDTSTVFYGNGPRIMTWSYISRWAQMWDLESNRMSDTSIGSPLTNVRKVLYNDKKGRFLSLTDLSPRRGVTIPAGGRLWNKSGKGRGDSLYLAKGAVFSIDGDTILTWCTDGSARLLNVRDAAKQIGPQFQHGGSIDGAQLSSDGRRILTWSADGLIKVWERALAEQDTSDCDNDFPLHSTQLQIWALTGAHYDVRGQGTGVFSREQWKKFLNDYEEAAKNHYAECEYRPFNIWKRFFAEGSVAPTTSTQAGGMFSGIERFWNGFFEKKKRDSVGLSGDIVDANTGLGVRDARIVVQGEKQDSAVTDEYGRFTLRTTSGKHSLHISKSDYADNTIRVPFDGRDVAIKPPVKLVPRTPPSPGTIAGTVLCDSISVSNAIISCGADRDALSDVRGVFVIDGLSLDKEYSLTVSHKDYANFDTTVVGKLNVLKPVIRLSPWPRIRNIKDLKYRYPETGEGSGSVTFKLSVGWDGTPGNPRFDEESSTTFDTMLIRYARSIAQKAKFTSSGDRSRTAMCRLAFAFKYRMESESPEIVSRDSRLTPRKFVVSNFAVNDSLLPDGANFTLPLLILKEYRQISVDIVGYTDSTGAERFNETLSLKHANEVRKWLVNHDIGDAVLSTYGKASEEPLDRSGTEQGRAKNRRVEIRIRQFTPRKDDPRMGQKVF